MASKLQLARRIKTAQNISKTTKAMQMIAASKLKKAQDAALSSRPYVEKLLTVTGNLTKRVEKSARPVYMRDVRPNGKTLYVAIAPDKGLCGGLVTNLAREIIHRSNTNDSFITVGKKIESPVARLTKNVVAAFPFGNTLPKYDIVFPISKIIDEQFLSGKVDNVALISTHFVNIFVQQPHVIHLLPIKSQEENTLNKSAADNFGLFEPNLESIMPNLLQRYMEMALYQEILESYLAEQSARMLSMQNATTNAKEIIEDLKLEYNKTRQAKITSEILDITGASAGAN
ncbi:MAG TPA: ATP synthase F1 subunit gamma [Candidatus Sulfotelmatobacter sp.]|jgi:F-type H+-transporting ATPase subunit gamma|nr:ATP synthase F1 subunit gamma [Candidatus Sulfotelmatobacter sp.]